MGQDVSSSKQLPPVELVNEWNLTSDNSIWSSLMQWDEEFPIVSIRCFYIDVGMRKRGLPCVSITTRSIATGKNETVYMPTCYLRSYIAEVYFGERLDSSLLFKDEAVSSDHFRDVSYDLLKKTYRKLNRPCLQDCAESMPEVFMKMVNEMRLEVGNVKQKGSRQREQKWVHLGQPTPLEYINMYAVMYNRPAGWEIAPGPELRQQMQRLNYDNLRPSNYFFGATTTFQFNKAQKWTDDSKEYKQWLTNNCPDCGHCSTSHIIDFMRVQGRTCPAFSEPLRVRFLKAGANDELVEVEGTLVREIGSSGVASERSNTIVGEVSLRGNIEVMYDGAVAQVARHRVVSIRQPRVVQEYVGCLFSSFSDTWKNHAAVREGWLDLSSTQKQTRADPCWTFGDYQQNVVDRFSQQKSLLVNHYMGTGKTLSAIAALVYMRKYSTPSIRTAIIVMPNSIKSDWKKELTLYGVWSERDGHVEGNLYIRDVPGGLRFYLWTYEQAIENMHTVSDIMSSCVVVFDEAHRLNEYETSALDVLDMTRAALETRTTNAGRLFKFTRMVAIAEQAQYMIMLTGTPVSESILDVVPMFNMLSQVERHKDVFPRARVAFMNDYMYLDEKKAAVTKYVRTHYKNFGQVWNAWFSRGKPAVLMAAGLTALVTATGFTLPAVTVTLPVVGAITPTTLLVISNVLGYINGQEKMLAMTQPRDDQVLFRVNAIQFKPVLERFVDYYDNEDFESSAREYPYKVFRFERVPMSAYQLVLYAAVRLNIATVTQQRLSDLLDYRTLSADDADDRLANDDDDEKQNQYTLDAYFSRELDGEQKKSILQTIAKRYYAKYRFFMGVSEPKENGSCQVFAITEYMNSAIQYQVENYSRTTLNDVTDAEGAPGYWEQPDGKMIRCTAFKRADVNDKKRVIVLKGGRTFQVSKFSKKWLPDDYVEVSFRPGAKRMVVGPFWTTEGALCYSYKAYPTANEAKLAHRTFMPVYNVSDTEYLRRHGLSEGELFTGMPTFSRNDIGKDIVPMVCFTAELLRLYMTASIELAPTPRPRSVVRTFVRGGKTPSTVPMTPSVGSGLRAPSRARKPTSIYERYAGVALHKTDKSILCLSPGDAANVFADYPLYERDTVRWLGTSPGVDELEMKSRMNASVALNLTSHLSDEKLLRIANLSGRGPSPKWELMWNKYLNQPNGERKADIVYYDDGDDTPKLATVDCKTQYDTAEGAASETPRWSLPRTIVYSQFSEGRGGILDFCHFLMTKGAVQCLMYKTSRGLMQKRWRRMGASGFEFCDPPNTAETFTFCLIDKELPDEAFEFKVGDSVRWRNKVYRILRTTGDGSIILRRTQNGHSQQIAQQSQQIVQDVSEIRPIVFGNRGDENAQLLRLYNGTDELNCALIHFSITEGKSFKRANQIHIMEPMMNPAQLDQVIARAVRKGSHRAVRDPRNRFVEVVQWGAVVKHDAMGQVGEDTMAQIFKDAGNELLEGKVLSAGLNISRKTWMPGAALFALDAFDFINGAAARVPNFVYDWSGIRVPGQGPDTEPEKRGMRERLKNYANALEEISNSGRQKFQSDPQLREALIQMQLLWEQAVPDVRFLSAAFVTDKNENMISQTPDDLVFKECQRRREYMTQFKQIAEQTYTRDMLRKQGIQETPRQVSQRREDQSRIDDKIIFNK